MFHHDKSRVTITFDPESLQRCFLVADIMEEKYNEPFVEYGLLGLVDEARPSHVVATPLLPGQSVDCASVYQSGRDVLRMRREIELLSKRREQRLIPMVFIHRHPGGCQPSSIDEEFLTGTFIDQVSSAYAFKGSRIGGYNGALCDRCASVAVENGSIPGHSGRAVCDVEYAMCFSLIVNKEREHSITAVSRELCRSCGRGELRHVPARIGVSPNRQWTLGERTKLRQVLEMEIEAKVHVAH